MRQQKMGRAAALGVLAMALSGLAVAQTVAAGGGGAVSLPSIPLSPTADIGVLHETGGDTALAAGLLFGDTLRVRLAGDVSDHQQHLLAAAGLGFDRGYALIGLSQAREAVTGFENQKLKAHGLLAEAAWSVPAARVLRAFVNARLDKASDRHLATTVAQDTAVTVQDLLRVVRSGNTTRYRTTTTTTTTVTTTTTDQTFRGGERQRLGTGLDLLLRPTTVGHLGLNHQRLSLPGLADQSSTQGTLGLTEYFPDARANASLGLAVGSSSQGRLALAAQAALGNSPWLLNLNAWADTRGDKRQHGVYAGVAYQWGLSGGKAGSAYNPGAVPQAARAQLDDRLRRMSTLSDGVRGVQALGQVVKTESRSQELSTETAVSERVVTQTSAPPVVDDPDLVVPAGSGWALLPAVVSVFNGAIGQPISPSPNVGGLTDPKGRSIQYQASGLPTGVSINSETGVIGGVMPSGWDLILMRDGATWDYAVVVTAGASGSNKSISKVFTLRVGCAAGFTSAQGGICYED